MKRKKGNLDLDIEKENISPKIGQPIIRKNINVYNKGIIDDPFGQPTIPTVVIFALF